MKRIFNNKNNLRFKDKIKNHDWTPISESNDPQCAYTKFHTDIPDIFKTSFPMKKVKIGCGNRHQLITI